MQSYTTKEVHNSRGISEVSCLSRTQQKEFVAKMEYL